jgi:hypothetical protein
VALILSRTPFFLMVGSSENVNSASLIQRVSQFLNVEFCFRMLAGGSRSGISLLFFWNHYAAG